MMFGREARAGVHSLDREGADGILANLQHAYLRDHPLAYAHGPVG